MSKFLTFDEIRTHTLNGNVVESRRKLAVNLDHVTHIFPVVGEPERCNLCLSDEPSPFEVEGSLESVVERMNTALKY